MSVTLLTFQLLISKLRFVPSKNIFFMLVTLLTSHKYRPIIHDAPVWQKALSNIVIVLGSIAGTSIRFVVP